MSVSSISAAPAPPPATPSITPALARAADGDYKSANVHSSKTKDRDGDYKPLTSSAAAQSSAGVQASLTSLKIGG
jgi:hypothetical protein